MNSFRLVNVVDLIKTSWRDHYRQGSSSTKTYDDRLVYWGSWRRGLARMTRQHQLKARYSFGFPHAITWSVMRGDVKAILRISKNGSIHMALSVCQPMAFNQSVLRELESWRDYLVHLLKTEMGHPGSPCEIRQVMANATLSLVPLKTWDETLQNVQKLRQKREEGAPVLFDPFRRLRVRGYDQWSGHPKELTMFLWFPESGRVILNGRCFDWVFKTAQGLVRDLNS